MQAKDPILWLFFAGLACVTACTAEEPTEFSVVAYNLENLFDVDGVALFSDYQQDEADDPFTYSRLKLLTKLDNAAAVLAAIEAGGPDVILIQELENDFTPASTVEDFDAFLAAHADTTVEAMLTEAWEPEFAGYPSVAWLAKALADVGLKGYHIAVAPEKELDTGIAHVNAIFSRFPIKQVFYHELAEARDIVEAELDVNGHALWVYNNHWKSGASNRARESTRVQNARVLEALYAKRIAADPQADILLGGDLNSHYNHAILFPGVQTGINEVLGSQAIEGEALYNLWYELAPSARYSEVWRGQRGTLMHLILSPGLYDGAGISYVDSSFEVAAFVGLNADAMGRPLKWNFAGQRGGGASDHFPLLARFTTAAFEGQEALNSTDDALDYALRHDEDPGMLPDTLPDGRFLNGDFKQDPGSVVGRLYALNAEVIREQPLRLLVGEKEWPAYAPARHLRKQLKAGMKADFVVSYGFWKGQAQLVVEAIR